MNPTIVWRVRALRETSRALAWLDKNGPRTADLLRSELAKATDLLPWAPAMGAPTDRPGVRRIVLRRSQYQLFYRHDAVAGWIEILSLWSSRRGRGPRLR